MADIIQHPAKPPTEKTLASYKVYDREGGLSFVVIASKKIPLRELNKLFQNGMNVTVVDQRSDLVDKRLVD